LPILEPDAVVFASALGVAPVVFADDKEEELGLELSSFIIEKAEKELVSFANSERSAVRMLEYLGKITFGILLPEPTVELELDPDVVRVDGEVRRLERLNEYSLLSV